jgi:arabinan endo-1,5-alpha-L-arabinosidase
MFLNEDGWFVIAPHRYAGETIGTYATKAICGKYAYVNHERDISGTIKDSVVVAVNDNGTITGSVTGQWETHGKHGIQITISGTIYHGVALQQWDNGLKKPVMAISALSSKGTAIWASQLLSNTTPITK